jgi:HAD superfamily hydrolase (TIGR01509 family)
LATAETNGSVAAVIWDLDGVLVKSEDLIAEVDARWVTELGWPISAESALEMFMGRSDADVRGMVEQHFAHSLPSGLADYVQRLYREAFEARLEPMDGVVEALDALDRMGVRYCVASGGDHEKIRFELTKTGLISRFEGRIFSVEDVARGKPAPDLFWFAADAVGAPRESCLIVEDSVPGVEAARAAGMRALAFARLIPADRLSGPNTTVFTNMHDVASLIMALAAS